MGGDFFLSFLARSSLYTRLCVSMFYDIFSIKEPSKFCKIPKKYLKYLVKKATRNH